MNIITIETQKQFDTLKSRGHARVTIMKELNVDANQYRELMNNYVESYVPPKQTVSYTTRELRNMWTKMEELGSQIRNTEDISKRLKLEKKFEDLQIAYSEALLYPPPKT